MSSLHKAPSCVIWEMAATGTRPGNCLRNSGEPGTLSTHEARMLIRDIKRCGDPLLVLTSCDPSDRPDLFALVHECATTGLRTRVTLETADLLTAPAIRLLHACGASELAVAVETWMLEADQRPDRAWDWTSVCHAIRTANEVGLPVHASTAAMRHNIDGLAGIAAALASEGVRSWCVQFPLADTGADFSPAEYEQVFALLYQLANEYQLEIVTRGANHFRRYVAQRRRDEKAAHQGLIGRMELAGAARNDGKGEMFVSHRGAIYPGAALPLEVGNVRTCNLAEVYQQAPLFCKLRDPKLLEGKCGICEYRNLCGGSRAHAYAATGNHLAADPRCGYQPPEKLPAQQLIAIR